MVNLSKKTRCFISSSKEDLDKANKISEFLEAEGMEAATSKDLFFPGMTILENLQNVITKVEFVILLLPSNTTTRTEKPDANLLFEMGIIVGMGKPLLALVEKNSSVSLPSDLASIMFLKYEPQKIESIFRYIKNWAVHSLETTI